MGDLHQKKNHDYANDHNPFSNFEEAAAFAGCPVDMVFRVMIGIKIARLKELQASGKQPNNESLDDSQFDLVMYGGLQRAYRIYERNQFVHTEFGICSNCGTLHSSKQEC